ncbi:hypothetical protein [Streptomyces griseoviridis]|uniref:Uncharacterized protein n=1 Tax=Streptomyces griseoviridis TaxID=45398 RepID=A0ABT9LD32_STRGD|nr:hypothetical protein [Streptomyces griseoviridis]MDP9681559.1 hypothetical protein [Streptomyces griseoviridis]GGS73691.1 hypothetical protein GCM10010240_03350 [Streptomyces griseoviridis]
MALTLTEPAPRASALAAAAKAHGASPEGRSMLRWTLSLRSHEDFLAELATVTPEALDEAVRCATT